MPVVEIDRSVINVAAQTQIVSNQMQVLFAFCLTLGGGVFSRQAPASGIDGPASQVMQRIAIRAQREAEIALTELIEHPGAAAGL